MKKKHTKQHLFYHPPKPVFVPLSAQTHCDCCEKQSFTQHSAHTFFFLLRIDWIRQFEYWQLASQKGKIFPKELQSLRTICNSYSAAYKNELYFLQRCKHLTKNNQVKTEMRYRPQLCYMYRSWAFILSFPKNSEENIDLIHYSASAQSSAFPILIVVHGIICNHSYAENWIPGWLNFPCSHQSLDKKDDYCLCFKTQMSSKHREEGRGPRCSLVKGMDFPVVFPHSLELTKVLKSLDFSIY